MTIKKDLKPRTYQVEMMEAALKNNIIACLGTGTGKTYIGVMVVKELAHEVRVPFEDGGKRTFFLVPTVPLVHQQSEVLRTLTHLEVGSFIGDMKVDTWSKTEWQAQFTKYNILVMTAEIFRVILHHGFLSLSQVNLIIFDECHRAVKNHPYREIMKSFDVCPERPKILGLTASILNGKCKAGQLQKRITDLEKTLRSKAIIPDETSEVHKHGTKPKEVLLHFSARSAFLEEDDVSTIRTILTVAYLDLPDTRSSPKRQSATNIEMVDNSDDESEDCTPKRDARKYIADAKDVLDTLGVWCFNEVLLAFLREINSSFVKCQVPLEMIEPLKVVKSVLDGCLSIVSELLAGPKSLDHLTGPFVPPKLKRLLEALNSKNPDLLTGDDELCGVVFVQKRLVAYVLNKWLVEVSKHPPYTFIKSHFMVGHGSNLYGTEIKEICMESKQQRKVLEDFKIGKYNLLVASSVIEEGMDVPKCNLIIRFDPPHDYCAYVQSRGRARAKNSIYLLMTPNNDDRINLLEDLTTYNSIEKILKNYCQDREVPTEEEIDEHMSDDLKPPYMPFPHDGGARVTMTSAIQLLNRYCSKLGGDTFINTAPRWKIKKIENELGVQVGYQCTIWMPLISPIRDPIVGQIMSTKQTAKMAAALDTCEVLHKRGELDDNLLPINLKDLLKDDDQNDEEYRKELRLGASNKQAYYPKKVLNFEPVKAGQKCYFYILNIKLIQTLDRDESETISFFNPEDSAYRFAFVASQQVKNLLKFHMFTESGKVRVWFEEKGPYTLSKDVLKLIYSFHAYTFTEMVRATPIPLRFFPEQNRDWLLAPVQFDNSESSGKPPLCIDLMKEIVDYCDQKKRKGGVGIVTTINRDYDDALVTSVLETEKDLYYVINVCKDMSAKSPFPKDMYKDFNQYYKEKLKYTLQKPENPLIEVKHVSNPLFNIPGYFNQLGNFVEQSTRRLARRMHFPEELVRFLPYPASLHRQAMYLPCIIARLNSLIFVQDFQAKIVNESKVGQVNVLWPSLDFPRFCNLNEETRENMERELKAKEREYGALYSIFDEPSSDLNQKGPSPCMLLEALTTRHYCDMLDLERLETVGDSFLKYAVSLHLFCKHPLDHEGKLTVRKTKQISNANLLKLGIKKGIPSIMCNKKLSPLDNWLPPGYKVPPGFEESQVEFAIRTTEFWLEENMPNIWDIPREEIRSKIESLHDSILKKMQENMPDGVAASAPKKVNMQLDLRTHNGIGNKSVADCVEGLIGAYVVTTGAMGALRFLDWLGVEVFPKDEKPENLESCFKAPTPFIRVTPETEKLKERYYSGLENLENSINYVFKNKMYLIEALWHPSCDIKPITDCYQRLEFLGDAVLDYLITRYLYEDPKHYNPGELTDIRMALVNNEYFATLAVKYKFHRHMHYFAPGLVGAIVSFVEKVNKNDLFFFKEVPLKEPNDGAAEELEVPKVLGDVVESIAGAIYLDSGLCLKTVWKVFYGMMKKDIEATRENVPKNRIRELYELFPGKVKFQKREEMANGKIKVAVDVDDKYRFIGFAANKKTAKLTAAKVALYKLSQRHRIE